MRGCAGSLEPGLPAAKCTHPMPTVAPHYQLSLGRYDLSYPVTCTMPAVAADYQLPLRGHDLSHDVTYSMPTVAADFQLSFGDYD